MTIEIVLKQERETKNTVRYREVQCEIDGTEAKLAVGTPYLQKTTLGSPPLRSSRSSSNKLSSNSAPADWFWASVSPERGEPEGFPGYPAGSNGSDPKLGSDTTAGDWSLLL